MEEKEIEHYLKVLVELQLFPTLRAMTEGSALKNSIDSEQQKQIISFINGLHEDYKALKNRDTIIASTLNKMGMNPSWVTKKIEESKNNTV